METMSLPAHLKTTSRIGTEISITGKWIPKTKGGIFRKSNDSEEMLREWQDIHNEAKAHPGILSTEINHAVGQDAVLIHHVFENEEAVLSYFSGTASDHQKALMEVAKPDIHIIRGTQISDAVRDQIAAKVPNAAFGDFLFGYVKHDYKKPDPSKAIQVTAKWTAKEGEPVDELIHWWKQVGIDAYDLEKGLVRFEAYKVNGENALIIHETFDSTSELQFHLSKGTAHRYKKELDKSAAPENYFFRGPVSWTIRTYSKFLKLPATYSKQGSHFSKAGGNYSDGLE